ncbi:MAG: OPT/YSL family transporter [Planctomycetes bacterium]|nr:OPT/YSL family transporter [Planctomycetota bacterium]MBI3833899.1 OPT/YSL family transporter [Planctomycetota bacterium]
MAEPTTPSMSESTVKTKLPENAYRELRPGEVYTPMVPARANVPEVTGRSVIFGVAMNILFGMAATYLALKIGQGIETAIPISILAVGLSGLLMRFGLRRSTIIENMNVLAISTTSGIVAGGTVFTMPAIYLLGLDKNLQFGNIGLFFVIFVVPLMGAVLGVIFLVPFRRYFVKEMHGKLPFPEGTATNEILVSGAGAGVGAWVLIYSCIVAAIYTIISTALKIIPETFTTGPLAIEFKERVQSGGTASDVAATPEVVTRTFETLAFPSELGTYLCQKLKVIFSIGTGPEFLGLGYIMGLRYAAILVAGSLFSWIVVMPLLSPLDLHGLQTLNASVKSVEPPAVFKEIPKNIGIGCIFAAGLLSILKMSKVIITALREAMGSLFRRRAEIPALDRTDQDIGYPALLLLGLIVTVMLGVYFRFVVLSGVANATWLSIVSVVLALAVAFVFITVSAWAIATISVTPISGMTVTTIIITAVVLLAAGLPRGDKGMLAVLLVGSVVATALSMSGTLVTEFKLGYWTGATPRRIQWSAIAASVLASAAVTATIMILAKNPGYDPEVSASALQAPQANLMKSALQSFLGTGKVPWLMYGTGVGLALLLQLIGVSPLAFGMGVYLPMFLNAPLLIGALVARAVEKSSADPATSKARNDKGILIASGYIAGAAIAGVVVRGLIAWPKTEEWMENLDVMKYLITVKGQAPEMLARYTNWLGLGCFVALCLLVYIDARMAKAPREA